MLCNKIGVMEYDVIIIGGGASGLACAVWLSKSRKNLKIMLVDAGDRLGKKLAAAGNGQGNISNLEMSRSHYHGGNVGLAEKIACADPFSASRLFDCLFTADERGRIYPAGRQASALVDNLTASLKRGGVFLSLGEKITGLKKIGCGYEVEGNSTYTARFVVLATGGKAAKQFKTDGTSYRLATDFGHTLTPLYPSLVQLKTETKFIKNLKGIRADCKVTAFSGGQALKEERGDVIFTDYGVSGSAIFYISSYVTDVKNASLSLEFLPDIPPETILENLSLRRKTGCESSSLLSGTLHNQIGRAIISRAGNDDKNIVRTLKNFTLPVTGTLGFDYAQVTRGGIKMTEITDGLESKISPDMFFSGEILDVDGDCGGYNLQWAFTSGMAVADSILKRI